VRSRSQTMGAARRPRSNRMAAAGSRAPSGSQPVPASPFADPPREPGIVRRWIRGALLDNIGLKFLSLVLAATVFLLVNTDKEREIRVRVPLEYKLPADKVMTSERVNDVTVTIKGPWRRLRAFDERELDRITLDVTEVQTGDYRDFPIGAKLVSLPAGLSVVSINPPSVRVAFDKRVSKTVEVTAVIAGRPQHGYFIAEHKVVPAAVTVRGGERALASLTAVRTHDVSAQNRSESFDASIDLAPPAGVEVEPGQVVTVYVRIEEELVTRRLAEIPIGIRGEGVDPEKGPTRWTVAPSQVEVTLTGALLAIEKAKDQLVAYVKVTPADVRPREAEVVVEGIPPGVGRRISPERVKLTPAPAPRAIP